jgi:hypothetical protein
MMMPLPMTLPMHIQMPTFPDLYPSSSTSSKPLDFGLGLSAYDSSSAFSIIRQDGKEEDDSEHATGGLIPEPEPFL